MKLILYKNIIFNNSKSIPQNINIHNFAINIIVNN